MKMNLYSNKLDYLSDRLLSQEKINSSEYITIEKDVSYLKALFDQTRLKFNQSSQNFTKRRNNKITTIPNSNLLDDALSKVNFSICKNSMTKNKFSTIVLNENVSKAFNKIRNNLVRKELLNSQPTKGCLKLGNKFETINTNNRLLSTYFRTIESSDLSSNKNKSSKLRFKTLESKDIFKLPRLEKEKVGFKHLFPEFNKLKSTKSLIKVSKNNLNRIDSEQVKEINQNYQTTIKAFDKIGISINNSIQIDKQGGSRNQHLAIELNKSQVKHETKKLSYWDISVKDSFLQNQYLKKIKPKKSRKIFGSSKKSKSVANLIHISSIRKAKNFSMDDSNLKLSERYLTNRTHGFMLNKNLMTSNNFQKKQNIKIKHSNTKSIHNSTNIKLNKNSHNLTSRKKSSGQLTKNWLGKYKASQGLNNLTKMLELFLNIKETYVEKQHFQSFYNSTNLLRARKILRIHHNMNKINYIDNLIDNNLKYADKKLKYKNIKEYKTIGNPRFVKTRFHVLTIQKYNQITGKW